jgi:hypothetical protein
MVPVSDLTAGILAEVIRRQPASRERTAFAWQMAVGPALARSTTVSLENGVLTVRPRSSQWKKEIERASATILERMGHLLGAGTVTRIQVADSVD